jgi:predicted DNA-binding transcriptional regulator YafY
MDRTERFYRIHGLLRTGRQISMSELQQQLEVSRATITRDLEYLRDRMGAPIVWDPLRRGYRYDKPLSEIEKSFELPGIWLTESEMHALLTLAEFTESVEPDTLLGPLIRPLKERLSSLMSAQGTDLVVLQQRVRLLRAGHRYVPPACFEAVSSALLSRQRLLLKYRARFRNELTEREVSPQRLINYRNNWFLDAWCHSRDALRRFALDSIEETRILAVPAHEVSHTELDTALNESYGIFNAPTRHWAVLRFSVTRSRWVKDECWHPKQRQHTDPDGGVVLEVPYGDSRELLLDVLRHGAHVEVLGPEDLRAAVTAELALALENYKS